MNAACRLGWRMFCAAFGPLENDNIQRLLWTDARHNVNEFCLGNGSSCGVVYSLCMFLALSLVSRSGRRRRVLILPFEFKLWIFVCRGTALLLRSNNHWFSFCDACGRTQSVTNGVSLSCGIFEHNPLLGAAIDLLPLSCARNIGTWRRSMRRLAVLPVSSCGLVAV